MSGVMTFEERNIANSLIWGIASMAERPSREQIEKKARQVAELFGYTGDLRRIVDRAMISVKARVATDAQIANVGATRDD
jgi:hypothetical protein